MAALAAPIISGIGSLFGGLFGGNSADKATQQYIAQLQKAQGFLQDQEKQGTDNFSPFLQGGQQATRQLSDLLGTNGSGLLTPWSQTFQAPTADQAAQTPGYQFQLKAGQDAMQNSAAAKGGLLTGRTLADLNNYAQGTASTNYQNTFNNAFTQYQSAYDAFNNNQNNTYQRLMGLSGQGMQAASGDASLMSNFGGDIAQLYGQMGAARAAGTIGSANSITGMIPGLVNSGTSLLSGLLGKKTGGGDLGINGSYGGYSGE